MKLQRHIVEVGGEHDKAVTEEVGHTAGKPYQIVLDAESSDLYDVLAYMTYHSAMVDNITRAKNAQQHF